MQLSGTLRRTAALAALAGFGAVAAFATIAPTDKLPELPEASVLVEALSLHAAELPSPAEYIREEQLHRGDTLTGFLGRLGIDDSEIARLSRLNALRSLRPGTSLRAQVSADGHAQSLTYLSGRDTLVRIEAQGDGYRTLEEQATLETRVMMSSSMIRSSLFAATDAVGIPDGIAM